ncbi:hypothetical protein HB884_04895 [Listeria booriae]|uniref:deaminase n=1 Tax=Listeria booriae TaxID=1552123 RepID=UPI00162348F2|nr:deaminase [Listeria booriae]MBC1523541.1 hypothetical protein [Listeria booriae]
MDIKYKESEWEKSEKALKSLIGLGWGKGVTDYLKKINKNFEDVQHDIQKDDSDGVISFSFTDKESKYQEMFEKMEVLHSYADNAGNMVERVIDEPFYKDIDKFVEKMEGLSIEEYETKNTIGATQIISTGAYSYGMSPTTTEVKKDKINLKDIMAGDNFFADNLKAQFAEYSKQNPDQKFTYDQYQSAVSSSRAFEYNSIRDDQQNTEFWRDIGIAVVIIGVSIVCPPAGLALGVAYGTLELTSAATGKDWLTGREMDGGERATRGAFALLDVIPGVKGIRAFSQATKAGGFALDAAQVGSKLTLKQTARQGLSNLDMMGKQAFNESIARVRKIPNVMKDVANSAKTQVKNGTVQAGKLADGVVTGAKNLNFGRVRVVADSIGGTHVAFNAAENTHRFENIAKSIVKEGSDEAGKHTDTVLKNYDELERFRAEQGYGSYSLDSKDTVASIKIGDETYFGVNSSISPESKAATIESRRRWFSEITWSPPKPSKPSHLGHTQSLSHAESHSLLQAYEKLGSLPSSVTMTVDRVTCGICLGELPIILRHVGVEELKVFSGGKTVPTIIKAIK